MLHFDRLWHPHRRRATARPRRPPSVPPRFSAALLVILLKLALSVGLMAFVLRDTSLASLWAMLRRVQPGWAIAALCAHIVMMAVSVWRWNLLLRAQHVEVPARTLSESFWIASFFNNFLPSNIGGDVVRIADTSKPAGFENPGDHRGPGRSAARPVRPADRGGDRRGAVALARSRGAGPLVARGRGAGRRRGGHPGLCHSAAARRRARAGAGPRASVGAGTFRTAPGRVRAASAPGHRRWSGRWPARSWSRW